MTIAVVMPAWNEAHVVGDFLRELDSSLRRWQPTYVVVDDCSSDDTRLRVEALIEQGLSVVLLVNASNLGHGPSTLRALRAGLMMSPDAIVAVDSDGQFLGQDVASVVETLLSRSADVVEGVRTERRDPSYRTLVSQATRVLVWTRARALPADANTPLRAYRPAVLEQLLGAIPAQASTPNLLISAECRRRGLEVVEVPVASIVRTGSVIGGTTWGNRWKTLPSRRFIVFCAKATREWLGTAAAVKGVVQKGHG